MLDAYRAETADVMGSIADPASFEKALAHCCVALARVPPL
jgi:hypothetical protein